MSQELACAALAMHCGTLPSTAIEWHLWPCRSHRAWYLRRVLRPAVAVALLYREPRRTLFVQTLTKMIVSVGSRKFDFDHAQAE